MEVSTQISNAGLTILNLWQGHHSPCHESLRWQCIKLWEPHGSYIRDLRKLEVPGTWNLHQEKLQAVSKVSPRQRLYGCNGKASDEAARVFCDLKITAMCLRCWTWKYCLPCGVSFLLFLFPFYSSLWGQECLSCTIHCILGKHNFLFFVFF